MSGIKDYYDGLAADSGSVEVPEWAMKLYIGPLTMEQYKKIVAAGEQSDAERSLAIIFVCSKNSDGGLIFGKSEQMDLRLYGTPRVVSRVAGDIWNMAPQGDVGVLEEGEGEKKS